MVVGSGSKAKAGQEQKLSKFFQGSKTAAELKQDKQEKAKANWNKSISKNQKKVKKSSTKVEF